MRIVGGLHRGKRLAAPEDGAIRPTADRAREALFNILQHGDWPLRDAAVLDVFAGTGAVGCEALSRGAGHVDFLDSAPAAVALIRQNLKAIGREKDAGVLQRDARRPGLARSPAALAFFDAPYRSGLAAPALAALDAAGWLAPDAVCVIEQHRDEPFDLPRDWTVGDDRRYGPARFLFLRRERPAGEDTD